MSEQLYGIYSEMQSNKAGSSYYRNTIGGLFEVTEVNSTNTSNFSDAIFSGLGTTWHSQGKPRSRNLTSMNNMWNNYTISGKYDMDV